MAATYEPIATTTLSSNQSSVTFSSIPGTYTDLVLILVGQNTPSQDNFRLTMNNDTGSNYSYTYLSGNGTSASSGRGSNATPMYIGNLPSSQWATNIAHIMNYANTTTFKTVLSRQSGTSAEAWINMWRSTAAITTIKVDTGAGNYVSGSTFTLYGIAAA